MAYDWLAWWSWWSIVVKFGSARREPLITCTEPSMKLKQIFLRKPSIHGIDGPRKRLSKSNLPWANQTNHNNKTITTQIVQMHCNFVSNPLTNTLITIIRAHTTVDMAFTGAVIPCPYLPNPVPSCQPIPRSILLPKLLWSISLSTEAALLLPCDVTYVRVHVSRTTGHMHT